MNSETTSILNICLEIEGLLCLLERRGDSTHKNVTALLRSKSAALQEAVERIAQVQGEESESELQVEVVNQPELQTITYVASDDSEQIELGDFDASDEDEEEVEDLKLEQTADFEPVNVGNPEPAEKSAINDAVPIELTINDKFRFRRELFRNSDVDLVDALQIAASMASIEEIEDYFYNDLCFDPEKDVVKDFMRVVTSRI